MYNSLSFTFMWLQTTWLMLTYLPFKACDCVASSEQGPGDTGVNSCKWLLEVVAISVKLIAKGRSRNWSVTSWQPLVTRERFIPQPNYGTLLLIALVPSWLPRSRELCMEDADLSTNISSLLSKSYWNRGKCNTNQKWRPLAFIHWGTTLTLKVNLLFLICVAPFPSFTAWLVVCQCLIFPQLQLVCSSLCIQFCI